MYKLYDNILYLLQMNRLTKDCHDIWEKSSEDVHHAYGKEYIVDGFIKIAEEGKSSSAINIVPVIEAMADAVLAVNPKYRYAVGGSKNLFDPFMVNYTLKLMFRG